MSVSSFTGLQLEEHNLTSLTQCLLTDIADALNNRDNFPNLKAREALSAWTYHSWKMS
jgi:hypothetical protein